jgi:hypothetical protein
LAPEVGPVVEVRPVRDSAAPVPPALVVSSPSGPVVRRAETSPGGVGEGPAPGPPVAAAQAQPTTPGAEAAPASVDVARVADQVYGLLVRRLANERQRKGV